MFSLQLWVLRHVREVFLGCSAYSWCIRLFRNDAVLNMFWKMFTQKNSKRGGGNKSGGGKNS